MLGDLLGDLFLHGKNIIEFAAEVSAPQMRLSGHIHQLNFDGQRVGALHYPAGQNGAHAELAAQRRGVHLATFVAKHCAAWQHAQFWKLREIIDEHLRDSVA